MAALPRQLPFDNDISIDPKKLFELVSLGTSTEIELPARLNAWRHVSIIHTKMPKESARMWHMHRLFDKVHAWIGGIRVDEAPSYHMLWGLIGYFASVLCQTKFPMYAMPHSATITMEVSPDYWNKEEGQTKNYTLFEISRAFAKTVTVTLTHFDELVFIAYPRTHAPQFSLHPRILFNWLCDFINDSNEHDDFCTLLTVPHRQRSSELWVLDVVKHLLSDTAGKETVAEWEWAWPGLLHLVGYSIYYNVDLTADVDADAAAPQGNAGNAAVPVGAAVAAVAPNNVKGNSTGASNSASASSCVASAIYRSGIPSQILQIVCRLSPEKLYRYSTPHARRFRGYISMLCKCLGTRIDGRSLFKVGEIDDLIAMTIAGLRAFDGWAASLDHGVSDPDCNWEILVQLSLVALHLAKVPGTQNKLIAAGVLELSRTKLNLNLRAFNRSADVLCALMEVTLIGREESNNKGVSPAIIEKMINELKRIASRDFIMLAIHSGKPMLDGTFELSFSDRNKALLLGAGLLPILMQYLSEDGAVQDCWGMLDSSSDADRFTLLRQDITLTTHKIILNLVLCDFGKTLMLSKPEYVAQIKALLATAESRGSVDGGANMPAWHHTLRQTSFELGIGNVFNTSSSSSNSNINAHTDRYSVAPSAASLSSSQGVLSKQAVTTDGGGDEDVVAATSMAKKKKKHVMISYCWKQQPMVLRINEALQQANFNVWIDVEQMKGSTVDAMAAAVEGSSCILICMSKGHKESANCRLEANYAQACKIPMVFVMLEDGYTPNGWAGILKGSELHYTFFDEKSDDVFKKNINAVGERLEQFTGPVASVQPATATNNSDSDGPAVNTDNSHASTGGGGSGGGGDDGGTAADSAATVASQPAASASASAAGGGGGVGFTAVSAALAPALTSSTPQPLQPPSFSIEGARTPVARFHQSQPQHFQSPYASMHSQGTPPPPSPGLEVALAQLTQQQAHTHQQLFSQQVAQLQNQLAHVQKDVSLLHEHHRQQYEQGQLGMLCLVIGVAVYTFMKK